MNASIRRLVVGMGCLVALGAAGAAWAITLDEARAAGYVCERGDGYVGVRNAAPGVQQMVDSVNAQRRARYQEVAAGNGQPLNVVEALAAERLAGAAPRC